MQLETRLTLDGLLAFLGGALALFGVWWSNRRSVRNLERQLETERRVRAEEADGRRLAVAKAILFEIDAFYRLHVRGAHEALKNWNPQSGPLFDAKPISSRPFPVYEGNAANLGSLEEGLVSQIVNFYGAAARYLSALAEYKSQQDRYNEGSSAARGGLPGVPSAYDQARSLLKQIKDSLSRLVNITYLASKKLCERTGMEFAAPIVGVAGEGPSVEKIAAAQRVANAQAH